MQVKINSKNEAVTLDSLKDFYISEIGKAGTAYGISKQLGKSHNYIHEILNKPKSVETLQEVYYLVYPNRKSLGKKK
jgi:hypothetical protein